MRFPKCAFWILLAVATAGLVAAPSPQTARTRLADGFDQPVGKPDAEGYYKSRGFRPGYHMGEDWNGLEGGNSDLGRPVYATGHGIVVLARDMRMSWGNLVIIRHTFIEDRHLKTVDSVYAHLDKIMVREGRQVVRGQQVGTIGTNRGMYTAHLHFEVRKNLSIGFNQRAFRKDFANYYAPSAFIAQRRKLPGGGRSALVAMNTFSLNGEGPPSEGLPAAASSRKAMESAAADPAPTPAKRPAFRINRFEDP